jgi:molybdate transport system substrate-binding protein
VNIDGQFDLGSIHQIQKTHCNFGGIVKKPSRRLFASILGVAIVPLSLTYLRASELKVLAGGAMTAVWVDLKPKFEQASGHKLIVRFGTTPELIKLATTGGPFDLGVVPREVFKDAAAQGQFVAGPTTDIARVGLGVAVRSGAPKPDISTPDALKQTLVKAHSIATIPASAAGAQVLRAFERLGIGEAMKAKTKAQPGPAKVVEAVSNGEAELGVFLINVLTAPGLDVVGPFPGDLQQDVVFTAALSKDTKETAGAQALINYLKTPEAAAIIKAKGVTP